ncbi:MAG: hypothetical protein ABJE79_09925 [Marinomonas sp.]
MKTYFRVSVLMFLICVGVITRPLYAEVEHPNFVFGLGYGVLDNDSLVNIDFTINMPVAEHISTQVLLNSNYLITDSTEENFAQSELSLNWFLNNHYGRVGFGLGFSELEPMDKSLDVERELMGQVIGELFVDDFSLSAHYISNEMALSNVTSSRIGAGYYINEDQRISLYREEYGEEKIGWRLETYFQPKKYKQQGSVGIILRTGEDYDYLGVIIQYYFDHNVSLLQREKEFH